MENVEKLEKLVKEASKTQSYAELILKVRILNQLILIRTVLVFITKNSNTKMTIKKEGIIPNSSRASRAHSQAHNC